MCLCFGRVVACAHIGIEEVTVCCLQALSDQANERLSFAYKLRSPNNVVLHQFHKVSANGKDHM